MLFHLVVGVMVTNAAVDSHSPDTCAATSCITQSCITQSCITNTTCRGVLNRTSGMTFAVCFDPVRYPPTGNEQRCSDGQPLWVVNSNGGYSEAACGRVLNRTTCPSGYNCVIAPNDAYSVCCPAKIVKNGQCPRPQIGEIGICGFKCQSDGDCPDVNKCCRTACGGSSCTLPFVTCELLDCPWDKVCIDSPTGAKCFTKPKKGRCPAPNPFPTGYQFCRKQCQIDADCPGFKKCCPAGFPLRCATECRDPDPPVKCKTIECHNEELCIPFPVPKCVTKRCPKHPVPKHHACMELSSCFSNVDCPSGDICCYTGCARHCVAPA